METTKTLASQLKRNDVFLDPSSGKRVTAVRVTTSAAEPPRNARDKKPAQLVHVTFTSDTTIGTGQMNFHARDKVSVVTSKRTVITVEGTNGYALDVIVEANGDAMLRVRSQSTGKSQATVKAAAQDALKFAYQMSDAINDTPADSRSPVAPDYNDPSFVA